MDQNELKKAHHKNDDPTVSYVNYDLRPYMLVANLRPIEKLDATAMTRLLLWSRIISRHNDFASFYGLKARDYQNSTHKEQSQNIQNWQK